MDFRSYVAQYKGLTRLQRIFHLAKNFPEFQHDGVQMLLSTLKASGNFIYYCQVCSTFGIEAEKAWVDTCKQNYKLKMSQFDAKIKNARRAQAPLQVIDAYVVRNLYYFLI